MKFKFTRSFFVYCKELPKVIMRLFILLFCTTLFSFNSNNGFSQNALVKVNEDKIVSAKEIFNLIKQQTDYNFIYKLEYFENTSKVKLKKGTIKAYELLNKGLSAISCTYEFVDNTIIVKRIPYTNTQETIKISGVVKDENGFPLPGATVYITSTSIEKTKIKGDVLKGVQTDFDGKFTLDASLNNYLIVSYVGYNSYSEKITSSLKKEYQITLSKLISELEEVVVIGYGKQKRENVTGAISSIKKEDIEIASGSDASFDNALAGRIKGVSITRNSGAPGSGTNINIRGYTSPLSGGNNQPLFVIDGIPFNTDTQFNADSNTSISKTANPLLSLNTNNIESIDVLKDAAATSIYGSRGANGVIIITTKKGKRNKQMTIDFSTSTSFGSIIKELRPMNKEQYATYTDLILRNSAEAANNGQIDPFSLFDFTNGTIGDLVLDFNTFQYTYNGLNPNYIGDSDTNWFDEIYKKSPITHQYNLNIRGGTEKTSYAFGSSYLDQEGLLINNELKQYNFYVNIENNKKKWLKTGTSINFGHVVNKFGNAFAPIFESPANESVVLFRPDVSPRDENGNFLRQVSTFSSSFFEPNPLALLHHKSKDKSFTLLTNVFAEIEVYKNLKLKADISASGFLTRANTFSPSYVQPSIFEDAFSAELLTSKALTTNLLTNLTATYAINIKNKHDFNLLAGYAWERTKRQRTFHYYREFLDDNILINASNAGEVVLFGESESEVGLNSFFGRMNYSYKNLYDVMVNYRIDGSSKFGPNNKYGHFPSLSLGWNLANETFFKNSTVDNLKIRVGIGKTGSTNLGDFEYFQFFERGDIGENFYNGQPTVIASSNFKNPDIRWETTTDYNLGVDFNILKNKLIGSVDYYNRKTNDAIIQRSPIPLELGAPDFTSNLLDISNRGLEIELGSNIITSKDDGFEWSLFANWSFNRNKIESLNGANITTDPSTGLNSDNFIEGEPLGTIKGFKVEKIFQDPQEVQNLNENAESLHGSGASYDQRGTAVGDYKFIDINKDGIINLEDRIVLGSIQPDFFGGFSNRIAYKGIELNAYFQFSVGAEAVYRNLNPNSFSSIGSNNWDFYHNNTWTPTNTDAQYPRAVFFDPGDNRRTSDRNVFDTSYLRLKNVRLSYNIPVQKIKNIGIDKAVIFVAGSNIFTLTDWPGLDPEGLAGGSVGGRTSNSDPYPLSKTFSLGFNVQF